LASSGGSGDATVIIWDFDQTINSFTINTIISTDYHRVSQVAWSPDGTRLGFEGIISEPTSPYAGYIEIRLSSDWLTPLATSFSIIEPSWSLSWNEDSSAIVFGTWGAGVIDGYTAEYVGGFFDNNQITYDAVIAGSGTFLLSTRTFASGIHIFDWSTNTFIRDIDAPDPNPQRLYWNSITNLIAMANRFGSIYFVDFDSGELLSTLVISEGLWAADWSPDGDRFVVATQDGILEIWDISITDN
jgi:WD40 repeat protein